MGVPFQETPETKRNNKIIELYSTGKYTTRSLSRIFKISFQRVHQLIKNEAILPLDKRLPRE